MLQGLRTVSYRVDDLARATEWYTQVVGHRPTSTSRSTSDSMWAVTNWACCRTVKVSWPTGERPISVPNTRISSHSAPNPMKIHPPRMAFYQALIEQSQELRISHPDWKNKS